MSALLGASPAGCRAAIACSCSNRASTSSATPRQFPFSSRSNQRFSASRYCSSSHMQQHMRYAPVASAAAEPGPSGADDYYMAEYGMLKVKLLDKTRTGAGFLALYLLATVDGEAALCALLGASAGYGYLLWLCHDIDSVKGTDTVPAWEADKIEVPLLRGAAKVVAAYRQALKPRLLVPVALATCMGLYNALAPEPLETLYEGCLLLGFLTYKFGLVSKVVDDLMPKSLMPAKSRPMVERIEDELDMYGRPKKRVITLPTEVLPESERAKIKEEDLEKKNIL